MSTLPSKFIFFALISASSPWSYPMAINWFNGGPPAPAVTSTQSRFHAIVEAMEAEFEASWPSLSTVERQHALTALAQAKQFEVLLSAHVIPPEDSLGHKHNSLVVSVAQSVLGNSLKVDENAFRRSESERNRHYEEIRAAIEAYRAREAQQED